MFNVTKYAQERSNGSTPVEALVASITYTFGDVAAVVRARPNPTTATGWGESTAPYHCVYSLGSGDSVVAAVTAPQVTGDIGSGTLMLLRVGGSANEAAAITAATIAEIAEVLGYTAYVDHVVNPLVSENYLPVTITADIAVGGTYSNTRAYKFSTDGLGDVIAFDPPAEDADNIGGLVAWVNPRYVCRFLFVKQDINYKTWMPSSWYETDTQNVQTAYGARVAQISAHADESDATIAARITAAEALTLTVMDAVQDTTVFGATFKQVVDHGKAMESAAQYIPRP